MAGADPCSPLATASGGWGAAGAPATSFFVPIPPSTNNLFVARRDGKGRAKTSAYAAWAEQAGWAVKAQLVKAQLLIATPIRGPVRVLIEAPFTRQRDLDNVKPVLDLLSMPGRHANKMSVGVIEDDRWVDDLRIVRVKGTRLRVSIWRLDGAV